MFYCDIRWTEAWPDVRYPGWRVESNPESESQQLSSVQSFGGVIGRRSSKRLERLAGRIQLCISGRIGARLGVRYPE